MEHKSFTPLVMNANGSFGRECKYFCEFFYRVLTNQFDCFVYTRKQNSCKQRRNYHKINI